MENSYVELQVIPVLRVKADGEEYYACVARIDSDEPGKMQLETGVIPGGWYAHRKLMDWEKNLSKLPSLFEEMARTLDGDPERLSLEFYRSQAELHLFLPVRNHPPIEAA